MLITTSLFTLFATQVDTYGTQQPIALLKLLLERHGCYDRGKDLNWKHMKDLSYIAAMGMCSTLNATNLIFDCCCDYVQISYCVLDSMCLEDSIN